MQRFSNLCALFLLGLIFLVFNARGADLDMSISFLSPSTPAILVKPETADTNTFMIANSASRIRTCNLNAGSVAFATGTSTKPALQDIQMFMKAGNVTNKLLLACVTSGVYGKAFIYFRIANDVPQTQFQIEMKEVRVKSVEMSEDDGNLFAKVTLTPGGATLTAYTQQNNGSVVAGDPVTLSGTGQ